MLSRPKIALDPDLYRRAVERARMLGMPSVEQYVSELLERDLKTAEEQALRDQVLRQMKGLGYLE